jgi:two-component system, OmpR family, response regulator
MISRIGETVECFRLINRLARFRQRDRHAIFTAARHGWATPIGISVGDSYPLPMKLLIVEDDDSVASLIIAVLNGDGVSLTRARTCAEAKLFLHATPVDAIVLDVMLPDGTGYDLLASLRADGVSLPVLMLTSLDQTADVVRGLDAGADDYLTKPFETAVLAARVRALLRRRPTPANDKITYRALEVDRLTRAVLVEGKKLRLTPKEYSLLEHLLLNKGRVIGREELLEKVWNLHFDPGSNVVDAHLARLRAKLERGGVSDLIQTIRGGGFQIPAEAE